MHIMRNKFLVYICLVAIVGLTCNIVFAEDSISRIIANSIAVGQARTFSLSDISNLALENNFDIQLAKYDVMIARTKKGQVQSVYDTFLTAEVKYGKDKSVSSLASAAGKTMTNDYDIGISKKLPTGTTISVDQTNSRAWTDSTAVTMNPSHDSSLGVTVSQDLGKNFFGIQDRGEVKITQIDIENSEYASLDKIEQSLADVQSAYWDLVLAMQLLSIDQGMLKQAEKLYQINEEKVKDGLVEQPDFLDSKANYKQRLSDVAVANNTVKMKMNVLKLQLNLTEDMADVFPSEKLVLVIQNPQIETSLSNAFEYRRDYRQELNNVRMSNIAVSMKKNNAWPEINLKASMVRNGLGEHFKQSVENIINENHPNFSASFSVSMPLENRDAKSQLKKAQLERVKTLISLKLLERKIMIDVIDQVRLCNTLFEKSRQQKEIASLQEQKLKEQEKIFSYGRSNVDTIVRYQHDSLVAQQKAAFAMFDYYVSLINLKVKEGMLLNECWEGEI